MTWLKMAARAKNRARLGFCVKTFIRSSFHHCKRRRACQTENYPSVDDIYQLNCHVITLRDIIEHQSTSLWHRTCRILLNSRSRSRPSVVTVVDAQCLPSNHEQVGNDGRRRAQTTWNKRIKRFGLNGHLSLLA